jgi:putative ABC transport system permease protein
VTLLRFAMAVWMIVLAVRYARRHDWFRLLCVAGVEVGAIADYSPEAAGLLAVIFVGAVLRRSIWELYLCGLATILLFGRGDPQFIWGGWGGMMFWIGVLSAIVYWRVLLELVLTLWSVLVASFSADRWNEVFDVMRRNKLRTFLTSVAVAWGIFVLVTLLGMGQGLDRGMRYQFRREAANSIHVYANKTSIPFEGHAVGRQILFDNRDIATAHEVPGVDRLAGQFNIKGGEAILRTSYGAKANVFQINSVGAEANWVEQQDIIEGRFLNRDDIETKAKVVVIGKPISDFLMPGKDPLGEWLTVAGVAFQVVGVFTNSQGEENARQLYIPITTSQLSFNGADHVNGFEFVVDTADPVRAHAISHQIVDELAERHGFSPSDKQAAHVFDNIEGAQRFGFMFTLLSMFVVVIGCGTLAAGVVGVSNIMMITVKERTKEIGIRKALGATPRSIIAMIIQEAVFLTGIAGMLGLCGGIAACQLLDYLHLTDMIRDPYVNITTGIIAAFGLVVAGAIAGFVPARAAARVNPIHALRDQ